MTTPNDPNGRRKKSREVGYAPWKPYKAGQRRLTQILVVEAAGAVQQVASTTKPYGITTRSGSGFNTITSLREAALRAADRTVPTTILVVGDYDPTGEDIRARVADDVGAFAAAHDATVEVVPLALTEQQALLLDVEARITMTGDKRDRYAWWPHDWTVELEAMSPADLASIIVDAIQARTNEEVRQAVIQREAGERAALLRHLDG